MEGGGSFPCEICANIPSMQGKLTLKKKMISKINNNKKKTNKMQILEQFQNDYKVC